MNKNKQDFLEALANLFFWAVFLAVSIFLFDLLLPMVVHIFAYKGEVGP